MTRPPRYEWGVSLSNQLSSGLLLTRDGLGHGSLGIGNQCVDEATTAYLIDLEAPLVGTTCS